MASRAWSWLLAVLALPKWYLCFYLFYRTLEAQSAVARTLVCGLISCSWPEPCTESGGAASNVSSGLQVVMPSIGQTGTTSVHAALIEMGYRAYHCEERTIYSVAMLDGLTAEQMGRSISRCAVEAISLEPAVDMFPAVLQASPNAKVILTWRSYPKRMATAKSSGVMKDQRWGRITWWLNTPWGAWRMSFVLDHFSGGISSFVRKGKPFGGPGQSGASMLFGRWHMPGYNPPGANTYQRGVFKAQGQEEAYLGHIDEVRRLSQGRLMEFDITRHGYAELAAFLGRPPPPGNPPFPHPRSKGSMTNDVVFDQNKTAMYLVLFSHALFIVVGIILIHNTVVGGVLSLWGLAKWYYRGLRDYLVDDEGAD